MKSSALICLCLFIAACASGKPAPATRPSELGARIEQSNPTYWFKQPAVASVEAKDFQKLWDACHNTLINDQFEIDQQDYRFGLLTTQPTISKQFFEVWRSDAGAPLEVLLDSLQTIRRTVHFEFSRKADGSFVAEPKVVMEQSSHPERRITAQAQYSAAFAAVGETQNRFNDQGQEVPSRYWFALGRDQAMERELARSVGEKLKD